jgi:hypothetical protein
MSETGRFLRCRALKEFVRQALSAAGLCEEHRPDRLGVAYRGGALRVSFPPASSGSPTISNASRSARSMATPISTWCREGEHRHRRRGSRHGPSHRPDRHGGGDQACGKRGRFRRGEEEQHFGIAGYIALQAVSGI